MYSSIVKKAEAIKTRNAAYSIQTEGLALLTEAMSSYIQNTARIRHDQRHLLTLINLHSNNGNLHAIQDLVKEHLAVFDTSPVRDTGDDILDGLLTLFRKRAEAYSIVIDVSGNNLLDIPVHRDDLCLLLSNCFENAIESTKTVPVDSRRITVSIARKTDTGTIALLVRNPCDKSVSFGKNGDPISHRGDSHGFGTISMKMIVAKYNGLSSFSVEENYFFFRAVFFCGSKSLSGTSI